jgi:hypothetical protein
VIANSTLTLTLTRQQPSALNALYFAFIVDSVFKFCSVNFIGYNFHSTFCLQFCSIFPNSVFLLEVSRELPQRSILNTLPIARIFLLLFCAVTSPWLPAVVGSDHHKLIGQSDAIFDIPQF